MEHSIRRAILAVLLSGTTLMLGQNAKDDMKQAGRDVKQAGKATRDAAKNTGKATAKTTKTAGKKVKHGAHKTAAKVEEKTRDKQQ
jgi:predicted small secreted protein